MVYHQLFGHFHWQRFLTRFTILRQYKKSGETQKTIKLLQDRVKTILEKRYKISTVLPNYLQILEQVEQTREHRIIQLATDNKFKLAIHIIPSQYEIPAHVHPGRISIVFVQQGKLRISQCSLDNYDEKFNDLLLEKQVSVGLVQLNNIHQIWSSEEPTIFYSFRIAKADITSFSLKKMMRKISLASAFLLLPSFIVSELIRANETETKTSPSNQPFNQDNKSYSLISDLKRANKLRLGDGVSADPYSAAKLYQKTANRGNAEAQYWLGVMYLEGTGITDDWDEALKWVGLSSDQNYPPAEQLLKHLLVTDELSDC